MRRYTICILVLAGVGLVGCGSPDGGPSSGERLSDRAAIGQPKLVASITEVCRRRTGDDLYVLHGLWSDQDAMSDLVKVAADLGIYRRIYTVAYSDDQSVTVCGQQLAEVIRRNTNTSCDLIGHSLGGLVIRWAIEQAGLGPKVRKAWLLGTPNLGSTLAVWTAGGALDDLRPDSETLHRLNDGPRVVGATYDYLTIAGSLVVAGRRTQSDGVVGVSVANWSGLGIHARSLTRSTVNCNHLGLKNSPAALNQLRAMMHVQSQKL